MGALRPSGFHPTAAPYRARAVECPLISAADISSAIAPVQRHGQSVRTLGLTRLRAGADQVHCSTMRPLSRGSVTLASADPLEAPLIDPNYLDHPQDVEDIRKAVRLTLEIADQVRSDGRLRSGALVVMFFVAFQS